MTAHNDHSETQEEIAKKVADRLDERWGTTDDNLGEVMDVFEALYDVGYTVVKRGS